MQDIAKNHSERSVYKQHELSSIIYSYIANKQISKFTYCDLNGGAGEYEHKQETIFGSGIIAYRTLLDAKRYLVSNLEYNGYIFEKGKKEWPLLCKHISQRCPDHNFTLLNKNSLTVDRRLRDQRTPQQCIEQQHPDGMFYFDPHGDISPAAVIAYGNLNPNYMLLCNLQRKTILRKLGRSGCWNIASPTTVMNQINRSWIISAPADNLGWTWLMGVSNDALAENLVKDINERENKQFMFTLKSDSGQHCLNLITKFGYNARREVAKLTKYHSTVRRTNE